MGEVANQIKHCSVCNESFNCGTQSENQRCWCSDYPCIMPLHFEQDCCCPSCLGKVVAKRINQFIVSTPHKEVLNVASQYRTQVEPIEGIDYTIENGLLVFSEWYHLKRGNCCGNGCKNCPYQCR